MKGVAPLIHEVSFGALLADKAFDADWLLQDLDTRGAAAVIPPKANRNVQRDYDAHMYKWRHLIENYFAKIKEFRGIATRYDKTDTSYAANWYLTATLIARRGLSTDPSNRFAIFHVAAPAHTANLASNRTIASRQYQKGQCTYQFVHSGGLLYCIGVLIQFVSKKIKP